MFGTCSKCGQRVLWQEKELAAHVAKHKAEAEKQADQINPKEGT